MKTNILFPRLFVLMGMATAGCQLSTLQAQDTLYTYQGGVVVSKQAVLEIDSMTFISNTITCGAYIAPSVWKKFMCHNLGADTSIDAFTYSNDVNGDLYQWGRPTDGHEKRTSATTYTLATSNTPGNSKFILPYAYPNDWRSGGAYNTRWTDAVKAANDPCPNGYKVPSQAQWKGVLNNNTRSTWASGYKFGNNLFLPASGGRNGTGGGLYDVAVYGNYWSSTADNTGAFYLTFNNSAMSTEYYFSRTFGFSVRCIAE